MKKPKSMAPPARTMTNQFSNMNIKMPVNRRMPSHQTIENVVRVRLQNRVSHAGIIGAAQMITPNFMCERGGIQTAEELVKNKGDIAGET